ncbi:ATP-binding cassette domain-containing protein [Staphylococcus chromogenes]|nr:ATP-binding cassette domain-containing protein [Staphylococcus chromogenes]
MTDVLQVQDLSYSYGSFPVLRDINFRVTAGEIVCITGENGSGKSTLLRLLTGAYRPLTGSCLLFGAPAAGGKQLHRIGFVPQATTTEKISFPITARELVVQGLCHDFGLIKIPRARHYSRADELLDHMGLGSIARVPFSELSGGLQQRVLITRALIHEPSLLFLDEPTSGVDVESRAGFFRTLAELHSEQNLTIVVVTHNLDEIQAHLPVDSIYRIDQGALLDAATTS